MHALRLPETWNRFFIYTIAVASTFSIALSDSATAGLFIVGILQWIKHPERGKQAPWLFWGILVYIGISMLSGWFSPYTYGVQEGFRDNLRMLTPLILFFALDDVDKEWLLKVFFVFLALIAVYGVIQYFTGADWFRSVENQSPTPYKHPCFARYGFTNVFHAKGNFTHHLTYGGVLVLSFPIFVSLSLCTAFSSKWRWIYSGGAAVMLLGIVASLARSIWMGSAVALFVLAWRLPKKWILLLTGVGVLLLGGMLWQYTIKAPSLDQPVSGVGVFWQRFASAFVLRHNQDRLLMWEAAGDAIEDHFWFGIGLNNDAEVMPRYRDPISQRTGHKFFNSPGAGVHNIYLQTWINLGLLGLLAYGAVWVLFFRECLPALWSRAGPAVEFQQALVWGACAGITAFLFGGLFENNFRDAEVQVMLMFIMTLGLHSARQIKLKNKG